MNSRFLFTLVALAILVCSVTAAGTVISIPNQNVGTSGTVTIPMKVAGASGLAAADITIAYDGKLLKFVKAEPGPLLKNGIVEAKERQPGDLHVSFIDSKGISGDGELLLLTFTLSGKKGDTTGMNIAVPTAAGTDLKDIPVGTNGGTIVLGTATGLPLSPIIVVLAIVILSGVLVFKSHRRDD